MPRVTVVHARPARQEVREVTLPAGATVRDAVEASGLAAAFPDLDPEHAKLGVFGRVRAATAPVEDGDRVEVYRPLTADPKAVRRARAGVDPRAMRDRLPRRERLRKRAGGIDPARGRTD